MTNELLDMMIGFFLTVPGALSIKDGDDYQLIRQMSAFQTISSSAMRYCILNRYSRLAYVMNIMCVQGREPSLISLVCVCVCVLREREKDKILFFFFFLFSYDLTSGGSSLALAVARSSAQTTTGSNLLSSLYVFLSLSTGLLSFHTNVNAINRQTTEREPTGIFFSQ